MASIMRPPFIKHVLEQRAADFRRHPVWVNAYNTDLEEPWYDDDPADEATYRPWAGPLPYDRGTPVVDARDLAVTRRKFGRTTAAALAASDFNRDGKVDAADVAIVRSNLNHALPLFTAPAAAAVPCHPGSRSGRAADRNAPRRVPPSADRHARRSRPGWPGPRVRRGVDFFPFSEQ
jgi:hypothetical protein